VGDRFAGGTVFVRNALKIIRPSLVGAKEHCAKMYLEKHSIAVRKKVSSCMGYDDLNAVRADASVRHRQNGQTEFVAKPYHALKC